MNSVWLGNTLAAIYLSFTLRRARLLNSYIFGCRSIAASGETLWKPTLFTFGVKNSNTVYLTTDDCSTAPK